MNIVKVKGGFVEVLNLQQVLQSVYANERIYNDIKWCWERAEKISELWHGSRWQEQQEYVTQFFPGGKYFPLVSYSDKGLVSSSSGGRNLHPVYIFPAGLALERRFQLKSKFLVAYISQHACIREALLVLCKQLRDHLFNKNTYKLE